MVSLFRMKSVVAVAASAVLCLSALNASAKTRHSSSGVKSKTVVTAKKSSGGAKKSASHHSAEAAAAPVAAVSKRGHSRGKLMRVSAQSEQTSRVAPKPRPRGQQSIDPQRMAEIQQALIREHYLDGEPSGNWDQATRDALTRYQNDNHWQTRIVPDSRALIKLGLGPSQQKLLNPESAAIAPAPYRAGLEPSAPGGSN